MVSIELRQPDGTKANVVHDLPLRRIVLDDQSSSCNTTLIIEAGRDATKPVRHTAIEPIHIRLKHESERERFHQLQIVAENGTTVAIIHPGLSPELLKGLATQ
jgi:hypothetical protein